MPAGSDGSNASSQLGQRSGGESSWVLTGVYSCDTTVVQEDLTLHSELFSADPNGVKRYDKHLSNAVLTSRPWLTRWTATPTGRSGCRSSCSSCQVEGEEGGEGSREDLDAGAELEALEQAEQGRTVDVQVSKGRAIRSFSHLCKHYAPFGRDSVMAEVKLVKSFRSLQPVTVRHASSQGLAREGETSGTRW